jgi:hypothetical protein
MQANNDFIMIKKMLKTEKPFITYCEHIDQFIIIRKNVDYGFFMILHIGIDIEINNTTCYVPVAKNKSNFNDYIKSLINNGISYIGKIE